LFPELVAKGREGGKTKQKEAAIGGRRGGGTDKSLRAVQSRSFMKKESVGLEEKIDSRRLEKKKWPHQGKL